MAIAISDAAPTDRDITAQLARWSGGDVQAIDALFPTVYRQLYAIARRLCNGERPDHTLGATGLLHELYLELTPGAPGTFASRRDFYALAACAMRRALVDHGRKRLAQRRGGDQRRLPLNDALDIARARPATIVALDDALCQLETVDRRKARVVGLRFFAGLTVDEIAELLGLSARTVAREWRVARAMLRRLLDHGADSGHAGA